MACLKLPESLLPHLITGNVRKVMTSSIAFRVRMYHFVMMHVGNFKLESSQEAVHQTTDLLFFYVLHISCVHYLTLKCFV